jgi:uncharacterized membrane protein
MPRPGPGRLGVDLAHTLAHTQYTSPLPAPADLREYAEMLPDAPERLLSAGEREQAHRHAMEREVMTVEAKATSAFFAGQRWAVVVGGIVCLAYLGVMLRAIERGSELLGIGGAAFGLAAILWAARRDPMGPFGASSDEQEEGQHTATDDG